MAIEIQAVQSNVVPETLKGSTPSPKNTDVSRPAKEVPKAAVYKVEASPVEDIQVTELDPEKLQAAVTKLNDYVEEQKRDIRFTIDADTNKTIIKLLDVDGNVLKQIPSEEVLAILKSLDGNKGVFFQDDA